MDFWRAIKLTQDFTVTLNCPKAYFLKALGENTRPGDWELFESLTSGPPFKGSIAGDKFNIRPRQQGFYTSRQFLVRLKGNVIEHHDKTVINVEADGFNIFIVGLWIFFSFFFLFAIVSMATFDTETIYIAIPLLLFQAALVYLFPYFIQRRMVNVAQRETEKEFYYLVRDYRPGTNSVW
jgi:hypothetical protein